MDVLVRTPELRSYGTQIGDSPELWQGLVLYFGAVAFARLAFGLTILRRPQTVPSACARRPDTAIAVPHSLLFYLLFGFYLIIGLCYVTVIFCAAERALTHDSGAMFVPKCLLISVLSCLTHRLFSLIRIRIIRSIACARRTCYCVSCA